MHNKLTECYINLMLAKIFLVVALLIILYSVNFS